MCSEDQYTPILSKMTQHVNPNWEWENNLNSLWESLQPVNSLTGPSLPPPVPHLGMVKPVDSRLGMVQAS